MSERPAGGVPGASGARFPSATAGAELVEQLRATLERASELVRVLEGKLQHAGAADSESAEGGSEIERRLATAESDVRELASRLVDSEHQVGRLMNLYVATYQLHVNFEPADVQATIAEIAINLLGARRFVLLLRRDADDEYEVAFAEGMHDDADGLWGGSSYRGGDPMVDATLRDGVLRLGPTAESPALAAVPLRVQDAVVGAIVLLKLLDHKPLLRAEDRDLLDLLSAHAASALFAARLFAAQDRKLRTLESLVKLARGE
ncbi:MAG: GAF domain-containing protein [Thermoanaerobaculia bacterium]